MKKRRIICFALAIIALSAGAALYLVYNRNIVLSGFFEGLFSSLPPVRVPASAAEIFLMNWGADFLWAVSFTLVVQGIFLFEKRQHGFLMLCSLIGVALELMQLFKLTGGTFDILDIAVFFFASALVTAIIYVIQKAPRN